MSNESVVRELINELATGGKLYLKEITAINNLLSENKELKKNMAIYIEQVTKFQDKIANFYIPEIKKMEVENKELKARLSNLEFARDKEYQTGIDNLNNALKRITELQSELAKYENAGKELLKIDYSVDFYFDTQYHELHDLATSLLKKKDEEIRKLREAGKEVLHIIESVHIPGSTHPESATGRLRQALSGKE